MPKFLYVIKSGTLFRQKLGLSLQNRDGWRVAMQFNEPYILDYKLGFLIFETRLINEKSTIKYCLYRLLFLQRKKNSGL